MGCIKPKKCRVFIKNSNGPHTGILSDYIIHYVNSIKEAAQLVHGLKTYWMVYCEEDETICSSMRLERPIQFDKKFTKSLKDALRRIK